MFLPDLRTSITHNPLGSTMNLQTHVWVTGVCFWTWPVSHKERGRSTPHPPHHKHTDFILPQQAPKNCIIKWTIVKQPTFSQRPKIALDGYWSISGDSTANLSLIPPTAS